MVSQKIEKLISKNEKIIQQLTINSEFSNNIYLLSNTKSFKHPEKYKGMILVSTAKYETISGDLEQKINNNLIKVKKSMLKKKYHPILDNVNQKLSPIKGISLEGKSLGRHSLHFFLPKPNIINKLLEKGFGLFFNLSDNYDWKKKQIRFSEGVFEFW